MNALAVYSRDGQPGCADPAPPEFPYVKVLLLAAAALIVSFNGLVPHLS